MKFSRLVYLFLFLMAGVLNAESLYIAKITDMLGNEGYKIMTREEYSTASKEIMEESRIFSSVVMDCKKEWKENDKMEGRFQSSKVKARKITKSGSSYRDMEKAEEKLAKLEERANEKHLEDLDEHAKKWKRMKEDEVEDAKEELKEWKMSIEMVTKKMEEKLGRPVPSYGFDLIAPDPKAKH